MTVPGADLVWTSNILLLVGGLIVLGCGGELLVRGAARLARQMGISALVVGLTIVAFGTSTPEIAVTTLSAQQGQDDLAIANVVGSCIMNILLVLGFAALTRPLRVSRNLITTDAPVMVFFTACFMLFAIDNQTIDRWQGMFFVLALVLYTLTTYVNARKQPQIVEQEYKRDPRQTGTSRFASILCVIFGIAGLIKGADLIIDGAVGIAETFGISTRIIGLTIVAVGTSLPELATCVVAARRNQPDIAIGNIVGSNIFNILAVVGVTSVFYPLHVARQTLYCDVPVMVLVAVIVVPILRTGREISRREGAFLLCSYAAYLWWTLQ